MSLTALGVASILEKEGIRATVVDPVFVKPLDHDLFLQLFSSHSHVVTIEEHALQGGLGSAINAFCINNQFNSLQILNFGIPDTFLEHGSHKELMQELGLTAEEISRKILAQWALSSLPTMVSS
jgi:1-deoxy-D-xylulose-5-phosphate synthase